MNLPAAPLALTYDECRARFRHAAWRTGRDVETCAIAATGPDGQRSSIDVTAIGAAQPEQALVLLLVHAVNPWGMAWWRRQNESNVDLNRNCRRDDVAPVHNDAYDELHALACPDTDALPEVSAMLAAAQQLVDERVLVWVRDGLTVGQYRHPDGLFFGGDRTEKARLLDVAFVVERERPWPLVAPVAAL